jgi:hypothetical protein
LTDQAGTGAPGLGKYVLHRRRNGLNPNSKHSLLTGLVSRAHGHDSEIGQQQDY